MNRECPHCHVSLERYEDPEAVVIIATLTKEIEALRAEVKRLQKLSNLDYPLMTL